MTLRFRQLSLGLSIALIVATVAFGAGRALFAQAAPDVSMLHTMPQSVPAAVSVATPTGDLPQQQTLPLTFTLQPRNKATLERYVQDVATPGSPMYHRFTSPAGFAHAFGPDANMLRQVTDFIQHAGMHMTKVQSGGMFITASGTVQQIESALHTHMKTYRDSQGRTFFANAGNLALPANIAPAVVSIAGLDNAAVHHRMSTAPQARGGPLVSRSHTAGCPASVGQNTLTPTQLATAYNFPTNLNGAGQNVALIEFDGYLQSDISVFGSCFAPSAQVSTVVSNRLVDLATALPAGAGAIEDELDIEVVLGMAAAVSKIHVYEAPNTNQGLLDMLTAIANDDADATVSDSWGSCESDTGYTVAQSEELAFLQMAAQGQGVYVAAGDSGAYDCLNDLGSSPYFHGQTVMPDDPATQPYVTAVGGTTLTVNASTASYISETVWNNTNLPSPQLAATGGGFSQFWGTPSWQLSARASTTPGGLADPTGARIIPDVTANADPQTGYAEYCTAGLSCLGAPSSWFDIGGTSAAAPLWAALAALATQGSGTRIGLITPALYSLYGADTAATSAAGITVGGTTYYDYATQKNGATPSGGTTVFADILTGNNTFPSAQGFAAGYSAQAGYDAASGLGSMQGQGVTSFLKSALHFTAPHLYMAAQGNDQRYWLSGFYLNNGDNNIVPDATTSSGWVPLGTQTFAGSPAIADNGNTTVALTGSTALMWIAGVGPDGFVHVGAWNPSTTTFGGWSTVTGATCKGNPAAAYAQSKLLITCETPTGALLLNTYSPATNSWAGWATIGGGLTGTPTMATDGTTLLLYAPTNQNDWFNTITISTGVLGIWQHMATTCEATPAVAYTGTPGQYVLSCIAGDTSTMWANSFATSSGTLSGWVQLGAPTGQQFHNATAVSVDLLDDPGVILYTGEGTNNAAYVMLDTLNSNYLVISGWQIASQSGIFATNAATDYFGA